MKNIIGACILILTQVACSTSSTGNVLDSQPLPWSLGKFAPDYMEAYVTGIDVIDEKGKIYYGVSFGHAAIHTPESGKGKPAGWPKRARGSTEYIRGAAVPQSMVVVWNSIVEPQAYMVSFDIPAEIRSEMKKKHRPVCHFNNETITSYRNHVAIGLAPGGIAKVSIMGLCLEPMEVGRFEAINLKRSEELKERYGESRFLRPATIRYLENNPIPYGSW